MKRFTNKSKIRVLHISATTTGGVGYNLLMLARYTDKTRFELSFAIPADSPFYNQIVKENVNTYPLNISRMPFRLKNLFAFLRLYKIIKNKKYDIIHTHTSVGGLIGRIVAKMNNTVLVLWTIHGWSFNYPYGSSLRRRFFWILEKFLDRFTDHYVAISRNVQDIGIRERITTSEKVTLIYHGIEVKGLINKNTLGWQEERKGTPVIGTVGRLEPQKAIDDFLKAAKIVKEQIQQVRFIIVGDGPLKMDLEKLSISLGIQDDVVFTGWKENVAEYIAGMDIFCLPSLWEGFGIVLLEAMDMDKPIVATRVGGIPEIIMEGKGGILVTPGEPKELANSLCLLLSNTQMQKHMGNYNRERVKTIFYAKDMIKRYEVMYENLFKKTKDS